MSSGNVLWLDEINLEDEKIVGNKASKLGELHNSVDVPILPGFVTTKEAYQNYIEDTGLNEKIEIILEDLEVDNVKDLQMRGRQIRAHIKEANMPRDLKNGLAETYEDLEAKLGESNPRVVVRSSLIAGEKVDDDRFIGDQQSFLNISGKHELINAVKRCYASLFSNEAISYREKNGVSYSDLNLSVVVQKMGRSDIGKAGTASTFDPDTGFEEAITIKGSYGLGEYVTEGEVDPDNFLLQKRTMGIIEKDKGSKKHKLVSTEEDDKYGTEMEKVPKSSREKFCITNNQAKEIGKYSTRIEQHYNSPIKLEWVLDGETKSLYIINIEKQNTSSNQDTVEIHKMKHQSELLLEGDSSGSQTGSGKAKVLNSPRQIDKFDEGDILVTDVTGPSWRPILEKADGVITNKGGHNSHTSVVARELDIPAVTGSETATSKIPNNRPVTVDCTGSVGKVWRGDGVFNVEEYDLESLPDNSTRINVDINKASDAFRYAQLPVDGAGRVELGRIAESSLGVHPLKLVEDSREEEVVRNVRSAVGKIGSAFYPREVVVQFSDFTAKDYRELDLGEKFEESEENPMVGFRGASRYYDSQFSKVFELECRGLRRAIDELKLDNIKVAVPFCRTVQEAKDVGAKMKEFGLDKGDIDVYLTADTPVNLLMADEFMEIFDGFSIDGEDLAQTVLGIDKENRNVEQLFDVDNKGVRRLISDLDDRVNTDVAFCSDSISEEYLEFLIRNGVNSVCVDPDEALDTSLKTSRAEEKASKDEKFEDNSYGSINRETIGQAAGEVYDALNQHGEAKASALKEKTSSLSDNVRDQALGWLAKEEKVEVNEEEGEIKYKLN